MEADDISVKSINCILFKEKHIYQKIKDLNRMEAMQRAVTDLVILCCSFGMFFLMYHYIRQEMLHLMLCCLQRSL